MRGLYLWAVAVLLLILLTRLRVGAVVEFSESRLNVKIRAGALRIPVFPVKTDKKTKEKKRKQKKQVQPKEKAPRGGVLELFQQFLPLVLDSAKKFRRRLQVDVLKMELIIAAPDPADAAIRYGQANALLGSLWQPITQVFHVKDGRAHTGISFDQQKPTVYLYASLSLTLGQVFALGTVFAVKALGILIRTRNKQNSIRREAV